MHSIIVPTGYMGSGSSAFTDLISEFRDYEARNNDFEYVFLHCPGGLFDLEDKLLTGNTALRSDEALHTFMSTMKQLYDKRYWWVGNYKTRISPRFLEFAEDYVHSLIAYTSDFYWYEQENTDTRMFWKLVRNRLVRLLTFHKVNLKKPLLYPEVWLSYPSPESFYEKSRVFLNRVFEELGLASHHLVLDQLLLPHNLFRIDAYFDDNLHVFVADRDPRDVFLSNKYYLSVQKQMVPYPTEVEAFCALYRQLRTSEKPASSAKIHRFHFEDLIYHYDDTVRSILTILGLSESDHLRKKEAFKPEKSINNTQIFRSSPAYFEEAAIIEKRLPEYLYDFPYERQADLSSTF